MLARRRTCAAAVTALLVAAATLVGVSSPAQAAGPQIYGRVTDAAGGATIKSVRVSLFSADWTFLRRVKVGSSGVYQLPAPAPGTYHLQFVDGRPAYKTNAYAARLDVPIRVGSSSVQKNVRLKRGGAIGGVVKVKGARAAKARIRAVSNGGQVIEVTADKRGQYALGGLAKDDYRVYAYDSRKRRVGKSKLVRNVKLRTFRKTSFNLTTRPGSIRGFLTVGGARARGTVFVTAVNKKTGEYWVQKVSHGNLSLRGLTPGPYRLDVPDTGGWFGGSFSIGRVRAGGMRDTTINLATRGGTFSGTVVDSSSQPAYGIPNISVRLEDAQGRTLDERPANQDGTFTIGGTARQQPGVTVLVLAYAPIKERSYAPYRTKTLNLVNNTAQDLGVISMQRTDVPAPTSS
ncbi:carboxypeptidase-like regulatory domain-containing protein [Aeromicrobium endophyticum]|nr:carboxypeptidase-like regulatory domain-containing protein [Aeromicrobium endophyticum]